jgi:hypothetical protein
MRLFRYSIMPQDSVIQIDINNKSIPYAYAYDDQT